MKFSFVKFMTTEFNKVSRVESIENLTSKELISHGLNRPVCQWSVSS